MPHAARALPAPPAPLFLPVSFLPPSLPQNYELEAAFPRERFRDDVGVLWYADVAPADGRLAQLLLTPTRLRCAGPGGWAAGRRRAGLQRLAVGPLPRTRRCRCHLPPPAWTPPAAAS